MFKSTRSRILAYVMMPYLLLFCSGPDGVSSSSEALPIPPSPNSDSLQLLVEIHLQTFTEIRPADNVEVKLIHNDTVLTRLSNVDGQVDFKVPEEISDFTIAATKSGFQSRDSMIVITGLDTLELLMRQVVPLEFLVKQNRPDGVFPFVNEIITLDIQDKLITLETNQVGKLNAEWILPPDPLSIRISTEGHESKDSIFVLEDTLEAEFLLCQYGEAMYFPFEENKVWEYDYKRSTVATDILREIEAVERWKVLSVNRTGEAGTFKSTLNGIDRELRQIGAGQFDTLQVDTVVNAERFYQFRLSEEFVIFETDTTLPQSDYGALDFIIRRSSPIEARLCWKKQTDTLNVSIGGGPEAGSRIHVADVGIIEFEFRQSFAFGSTTYKLKLRDGDYP